MKNKRKYRPGKRVHVQTPYFSGPGVVLGRGLGLIAVLLDEGKRRLVTKADLSPL